MKKFQEYEVASLTEEEQDYPRGLRDISAKPKILYYKGNIGIINQNKNIAVVGTRRMSGKGGELAYQTGREVAQKGLNLVNGLALGCDAAAIRGALSVEGKCIAIMPCGLEQVQPRSNYELAEEILEKGGCLLSEYPCGTRVQKQQYIERDRIQSGISQGVIIIEMEEKSGTMHTARFALSQYKRLACYYAKMVELSSGNRLLAENIRVQILNSLDDSRKFVDSVANEVDYKQMTLF